MSSPLIKLVGKALNQALPSAGVTEAATLIRVTSGARTAGNLAGGTNPSSAPVPCLGFVSNEKRQKVGATSVESRDRIVCLLGETLGGQVPTSKDRITIDGATQPIIDLEGSAALWICLCRA